MLKRLFGLDSSVTTVKTEVIAGITTFLTMAYILAVNPNILSVTGMDKGALFTTTVLAAFIPTLMMGLYAKLPFALAPCMGLNAFFAYTVCLTMGYSWQFALTAVLIEGLIFILLTVTNLREKDCTRLAEVSARVDFGRYWSVYRLYRSAKCRSYRSLRCNACDIGRYWYSDSDTLDTRTRYYIDIAG